MKKPSYLKDAIATADGYISAKGEMLKRRKMTQDEMDAWNGVEKKKKKKNKKPAVVEVAETVEVTETETESEEPAVDEQAKDETVQLETTMSSKLKSIFGTK